MAKKKVDSRYEINSFERLCNVANPENCERLAVDIGLWVIWYAKQMEEIRKHYPEETNGVANWDIAQAAFTWIDDGKHEFRDVKVTDPKTGKTVTHERKK